MCQIDIVNVLVSINIVYFLLSIAIHTILELLLMEQWSVMQYIQYAYVLLIVIIMSRKHEKCQK